MNGLWLRSDGNGNLINPYGTTYTKRSDGLYEVVDDWGDFGERLLYDENLII
ncbi:hypothetical protein J6I39_08265 [bacterium]|nr:hypothetical protein [bacterium]